MNHRHPSLRLDLDTFMELAVVAAAGLELLAWFEDDGDKDFMARLDRGKLVANLAEARDRLNPAILTMLSTPVDTPSAGG